MVLESGENGGLARRIGGRGPAVAVHLARRLGGGLAVSLVSALGRDPVSEALAARLAAESLDLGLLQREAGTLPPLIMQAEGPAGPEPLRWSAGTAITRLFAGEAGAEVLERLASADLVYVPGALLALLGEAERRRLVEALKALRGMGRRTAVDLGYRPRDWPDRPCAAAALAPLLQTADLVFASFADDHALFGDTTPRGFIGRLTGFGAQEVVIKNGRRPCHVAWSGGEARVIAQSVGDLTDLGGAGEAFNAGYLAARLQDRGPEAAAEAGHALAAEVLAVKGPWQGSAF